MGQVERLAQDKCLGGYAREGVSEWQIWGHGPDGLDLVAVFVYEALGTKQGLVFGGAEFFEATGLHVRS